jgi:transcriptional regulator
MSLIPVNSKDKLMYIPAHFAMERPSQMRAIIEQHPLGALVTLGGDGLDANHIPFELDPTQGSFGVLTAHVARANPVWQQCKEGAEVLVIFRGNESYISPNWYPSKHETHRQVPTWNYQVVHVHGRLSVMDEERFVRGVVARLTRTHESGEPKAIVGIEIAITRMEGKAKLSQNREPRDRLNAADTLMAKGAAGLGMSMLNVMKESS